MGYFHWGGEAGVAKSCVVSLSLTHTQNTLCTGIVTAKRLAEVPF